MVPLRFVFRSRWWALLWAAGIVWTAVDYAGDKNEADGNNATGVAENTSQSGLLQATDVL